MFIYAPRNSDYFYRNATWTLKRCWFTRFCELTGRNLWLRKAYLGQVMYDGYPLHRWHDRHQHLLWLLKGN
jgi:hypothetical protein